MNICTFLLLNLFIIISSVTELTSNTVAYPITLIVIADANTRKHFSDFKDYILKSYFFFYIAFIPIVFINMSFFISEIISFPNFI